MTAEFSSYRLPPLIIGLRYSCELENPKPITENVRGPVLEALYSGIPK